MKKTILATLLFALSASVMTVQAAVERSFAEQLNMQKTQLRTHEFSFISDRYKQVQAHKSDNAVFRFTAPVILQPAVAKSSKFYPIIGLSYTLGSESVNPSFKAQLDSQKAMEKDNTFYPVFGMSFLNSANEATPTVTAQLAN